MTVDDPWADLKTPERPGTASVLRVNPTAKWNLFWARDSEANRLLLLRRRAVTPTGLRLPSFSALEMVEWANPEEGCAVALRLTDPSFKDIFYSLCSDIASRISSAESEDEAVTVLIQRAWRWQHLLRSGHSSTLGEEAQLGLIGELVALERHFLPALPPLKALAAWMGPLGAAHDFNHVGTALEAKCAGSRHGNSITIHSEFQLSRESVNRLFLHVTVCNRADPASDQSFCLSDVVSRIEGLMSGHGKEVITKFEGLLTAAGYEATDDYSAWQWADATHFLYKVTDQFPALTSATLPPGIKSVCYELALSGLSPFAVPASSVRDVIGGHQA